MVECLYGSVEAKLSTRVQFSSTIRGKFFDSNFFAKLDIYQISWASVYFMHILSFEILGLKKFKKKKKNL